MGKLQIDPLAQVPHRRPPAHDRLDPRARTGWLTLRLTTIDDDALGVVPGSGGVALYETDRDQHTVETCAKRQGMPVIPGTGIKGAVRTMYELLTGSCNVTDFRARCRGGRPGDKVCPACALFGHLGYAGRLSFDDAEPESEEAVRLRLTEVPVAWGPKRASAAFRLYDGKPALGPDGAEPRDFVPVEFYQGAFRCRMRFRNAAAEELGRLLLALGLGGGELAFFPKLGGKKFDGQGAVKVEVLEGALRRGGGLGARTRLGPDEVSGFVDEQLEAAKSDRGWSWEAVQPSLAAVAAQMKEGY